MNIKTQKLSIVNRCFQLYLRLHLPDYECFHEGSTEKFYKKECNCCIQNTYKANTENLRKLNSKIITRQVY